MRILSFYPTKTFKLIIEFENNEYKVLDIQKFLHNDQGLLKEICNDVSVFMSAELDGVAGTIKFINQVDFDNEVLYRESVDLESLMNNNRDFPKPRNPRKITRLPEDFQSEISKENEKLLRLLEKYKGDR